ncbi:MAG: tetratricopeptide repeat protein [Chloroflexia bacterium]
MLISNNLPIQRTPITGRERERSDIREILLSQSVGVLTLTGPAGIGKTRLALQSGSDLLGSFRDGVFFVPLAPVREPALLPFAIAHALGLPDASGAPMADALYEYLLGKQILLLLDNFEQIPEAAPQVAALLGASPELKIIVTSRALLRIYGEQDFPVPPLTLPPEGVLPPVADLARYEAVRLFVERASSVRPDFALTERNAEDVAEICRRLDGLPLALELAAARVRILPQAAIVLRLASRLKLLTGGAQNLPARQQTLYNAIAWSYDLLTAEEQSLFRGLSIFQGGCTLQAAEAVCGPHEEAPADKTANDAQIDVLEILGSLVDKSLIKQEATPRGEPRFAMLETIHEFASEKLALAGEEADLWPRYARYYLLLAEEASGHLTGPQQLEWLDLLDQERNNFQAVLRRSLDSEDFETALRLVSALYLFWSQRTYFTEGREQLGEAISRAEGRAPETLVARAVACQGLLAYRQSDIYAALPLFERALSAARRTGDRAVEARAIMGLGNVKRVEGNLDQSGILLEEALAIYRELGDDWGASLALDNLGLVAIRSGDAQAARGFFGQSLAIHRAMGDKGRIANTLSYTAMLAYNQEDYAASRALHEESLGIFRELGDRYGASNALATLGEMALSEGDYVRAVEHEEESLALSRALGNKWNTAVALENLGHLARLQGHPNEARRFFMEALPLRIYLGNKRATAAWVWGMAAALQSFGPAHSHDAAMLFGWAEGVFADTSPLTGLEGAEYTRTLAALRSQLGDDLFSGLAALGRTMSDDEAIELASREPTAAPGAALEEQASPPARTLPPNPTAPPGEVLAEELTAREVEVLRLVATGKSNSEVARDLNVSTNTVQTHLRSIYSKLGITSRTEAARFAFDHNIV